MEAANLSSYSTSVKVGDGSLKGSKNSFVFYVIRPNWWFYFCGTIGERLEVEIGLE